MTKKLFYNGSVLTMDRENAEAALVCDGKIAAVGAREALCAQAGCEKIDLEGGALAPAFIDAHSHITQFAASLAYVSLDGADSFGEIERRLKEYVKQQNLGPDEWVVGFGYDHNVLKEGRHPSRELLDAAAGGRPAIISHKSGHMGVASSELLRRAGVDEKTAAPEGGVIGRDAQGRPNGYLEETAFMAMGALAPRQSMERQLGLLERAQRIYASYGIATAQDGLTGRQEFALLSRAAEEGKLFLDVVGYADMKKAPELICENPEWAGGYRGGLRLGGYKIFLDGSPQGRTAWMSEPYLGGEEGYAGYPIYEDREVEAFVRRALMENRQLLAHCNGDAAAAQLMAAFPGHTDTRPVMIHAQLLRRDQLLRLKQIGMVASFFVAHAYHWGDAHIENFGMERAAYISPAASALKAGAAFTFHQDTPVLPPDMMQTVQIACERRTRGGVYLAQEERLTAREALAAVTRSAAYQYFEEGQKGRIAPGMQADLVWLERDPLHTPAEELGKIKVRATYRKGERIFSA